MYRKKRRTNIYKLIRFQAKCKVLYIDYLIYFSPYKYSMRWLLLYLKITDEENKALGR